MTRTCGKMTVTECVLIAVFGWLISDWLLDLFAPDATLMLRVMASLCLSVLLNITYQRVKV